MNLPAGYRVRPPTMDDFDAVAAVVVADELAQTGTITLGADFVRAEWDQAGFELGSDAWAVTDAPGTIIAYGQAVFEGPEVVFSWGSVHPGHRGKGVGYALFERIAAWPPPGARLRHAIYAHDKGAAGILKAHALQPVRHFWHMRVDLPPAYDPGPPPGGVDITEVSNSGLRTVHEVIEEALTGHFGERVMPFEEWIEEQTYDPGLWLLASVDGVPAGALTASPAEDRGWIDYLRVLAAYRGRGIAGALLRHSFARFTARGLGRVLVSVDSENATGATAVYERAGMRTVKAWDMWEGTASQ